MLIFIGFDATKPTCIFGFRITKPIFIFDFQITKPTLKYPLSLNNIERERAVPEHA